MSVKCREYEGVTGAQDELGTVAKEYETQLREVVKSFCDSNCRFRCWLKENRTLALCHIHEALQRKLKEKEEVVA